MHSRTNKAITKQGGEPAGYKKADENTHQHHAFNIEMNNIHIEPTNKRYIKCTLYPALMCNGLANLNRSNS